MKFFRIFFACVFCALFSTQCWAETTKEVSGSGVVTSETSKTIRNSSSTNNQCQGIASRTPCRKYGATKAECNGKGTCIAKVCNNDTFLVVKKNSKGELVSEGYCTNKSKGNCEQGFEVETVDFNGVKAALKYSNNKFRCVRFDDVCTEQVKAELKAEIGQPMLRDTSSDEYYCMPTKCVDKYVLNITSNSCEPCPVCKPKGGATCELTGSDGEHACSYNTSCPEGFEEIHKGQYNPSCSAKPDEVQKIENSCPDDASGNYPDCACSDVTKTYSLASNTCEDIQRETPVPVENECQDGEEGVYPICCDKNSQVYNSKNNSCDDKPQKCTDADKAQFPHATDFKFVNNQCVPTACEDGFTLQGTKCISDKIKDAEEAYKNAKENEQSLANRTLTAATMATTGIGGMELAQGLAEQRADKMAAQDMEAYMATFQCKIGNQGGKVYGGGDKNITVPGTNQLIGLYQQYVDLAASLKERKEALGMKPGIESEVVLDKANMGLYNDESQGNRSGTYASLYRAAMGNEKDAAKLQEMQDTTEKRVKVGGTVAATGTVGGMVGNSAINGKIGEVIKDIKSK